MFESEVKTQTPPKDEPDGAPLMKAGIKLLKRGKYERGTEK